MIPNSALPFAGGLVSQGLQRFGLQDATLVRLRFAAVVVLPLLAWLPLLVLSAIGGKLLPGSVPRPFLLDLSAHIRLLIALPLFVLAARVSEARILPTVRQFLARGLVPEESVDKLGSALTSAFKLGNSIIADILIIALIYLTDTLVARRSFFAGDAATWYAGAAAQGSHLTPAGIYYVYVGLPIVQFVLLRWYLRLYIWGRFLRRVSKLNLHLLPTHPDRVGGLGFLVVGTQALTFFAMAHGALLAAWLSTRVVINGAHLPAFNVEIIAVVLFVLGITIAPLITFAVPLTRAKRRGLREYGGLAARYANEFHDKWIVSPSACKEPLVGTADIQSLADMAGSYEVVASMRSVPITLQMVVGFAVATLLPVAPLVLTLMPLSEILKKLLDILLG
ncbi:MAG TPA: hypothetical protein VGI19_15140 [Candidatus Cybelea sp.]